MKRVFLLPIFLCLFLFSCRQHADLAADLQRADSLMLIHPDSSLLILRNTYCEAAKSRAKWKARHALLHSQALDRNYIDLTTDSIIAPAVEYYERHGNPSEKGKTYYYLGRIRANAGDVERAVGAYIESEESLKNTTEYRLQGLVYSTLGNMLYSQYSFDEALNYYDKALQAFHNADDIRSVGMVLEAKGMSFLFGKNNLDSSLCYYSKAYEIFVSLKEVKRILEINGNIALITLLKTHNPIRTIEILKHTYSKYNINKFLINDYPLLAHVYLGQRKFNEAENYARRTIKYEAAFTSKQVVGIYKILSIVYEEKDDPYQSLKYNKLWAKMQDSIMRHEQQVLIQNIEQRYRAKRLRETYENLRVKHVYQNRLVVLAGVLSLAVAYIVFLKWRQLVRRKNRELEESHSFAEILQEEYNSLQKEYDAFVKRSETLHGEKVEQFKQALRFRIDDLKKFLDMACLSGDNNDLFLRKFLKHIRIKSTIGKNSLSDIAEVADLCNNGLISDLKRRHPKLTPDDLALCGMISLGFTTDIVCIVYDFAHPHSLYNKRHRLRVKLGLSSDRNADGNLERYIARMIEERKKEPSTSHPE